MAKNRELPDLPDDMVNLVDTVDIDKLQEAIDLYGKRSVALKAALDMEMALGELKEYRDAFHASQNTFEEILDKIIPEIKDQKVVTAFIACKMLILSAQVSSELNTQVLIQALNKKEVSDQVEIRKQSENKEGKDETRES